MKRYHLFVGDQYYPDGGMQDYVGSYETIEEAKAATDHTTWKHIAVNSPDGSLEEIASYWGGVWKTTEEILGEVVIPPYNE